MPRKNDYLSQAYRVDTAPKGMTKRQFFDALLEGVRSETGELPKGLRVTWKWRNTPDQELRSDDFENVVQNSGRARGGFLSLMERRILKDASKYAGGPEAPPTPTKRSQAAKKGWETRKKRAQEKEQAKQRRSAAARKGWETRRANARKRSKAAGKGARKRKRK